MSIKLQDLTIEQIELLQKSYLRLVAEGFISSRVKFEDYLDCILARGEYSGKQIDYIFEEAI